jgi:hypothetical protein
MSAVTLMYLSQWLLCPEYVLSRGFYSTEAECLDEIQTKVLRFFLLAILSHLYSFALRFYISSNSRNL